MITKVSTMNSAQIESECRKMADSYLDYEMTGSNLGMCEHLDKEHFYRFTRGYLSRPSETDLSTVQATIRKDISSLKHRKQKEPFPAACFRQSGC